MSLRILSIPRYTGKDGSILLASMLPLALLLNFFLFGPRYVARPGSFLAATGITFAVLGAAYLYFTHVALLLAHRFPGSKRTTRRLLIVLFIFLLSDFVILSLLLRGYDYAGFLNYRYQEYDLVIVFCFCAILTVFLTFLNEGIARYASYRRTLRETEELRQAYMQSQLLGLKSQVNPHFLFNSLNTLSSLISDEQDAAAERFLDELSKVYRYLLRNNEDYLVVLQQELSFLRSYAYLLRERHGAAFQLTIADTDDVADLQVPPLTLQFILEDILEQNSFSREAPLLISVCSMGKALVLAHNRQERHASGRELTGEAGLENLRAKYRLLAGKDLLIEEQGSERHIIIPLIEAEAAVWSPTA
ncbi:sensor histidine kinase [Flaviaesturariibacter amylovorans]|uniref:Signal transduction histidine kinase internal region domain-containing protein n=1 Tax=Flaviaesturariibacter amylovorans TaxID=1084520 RepID=A0ABP8GJ51_9BACT